MYKVKNPDPNIIARMSHDKTPDDFDIRPTEAQKKILQNMFRSLHEMQLSDFATVKRIYKISDAFNRMTISKHSICQRGCAHCCKVGVILTTLEAKYIALNIGELVNTEEEETQDYTGQYCPFLDQDKAECSIYEYRPIVCRSFAAFDHVDICADDSYPQHLITCVDPVRLPGQVQTKLAVILMQISQSYPIKDIRQFFPQK